MTAFQITNAGETRIKKNGKELSEPMATMLRRSGAVGSMGNFTIGHIGMVAADGAWWVATDSGGHVSARVAISCIVKPQLGDLVQMYRTALGSWILAILERRNEGSDVGSEIVLDFGMAGVQLQARDVRVQAHEQLTLEAARFASRAEVVTQTASERHVRVSGTDATYAGNTFIHTERHLGLHATSAVLKAEALLKMDAGQIHMG